MQAEGFVKNIDGVFTSDHLPYDEAYSEQEVGSCAIAVCIATVVLFKSRF